MDARVFLDRKGVWAFGLGYVLVTSGVLLHIPMFMMGKAMGFRLADMPMDPGMIAGMYMIIIGVGVAGYGLLPRAIRQTKDAAAHIAVVAPEDARLGPAHWRLMAVLVVALIINVMKPATLGFVMSGTIREYQVAPQHAALVPFFALVGTALGSALWGMLADIYGRKASILLSSVVFVGTSICGATPSLNWNMIMCFLMGLGAGGMLPVTYAPLAETMLSRHRGWALVLMGGLGAVGGYFAASDFAWWLTPVWSWRILWLLNLPTGLLLICMGGLIPESAKFLLARGRDAEAHKVMRLFDTHRHRLTEGEEDESEIISHHHGHHHNPDDTFWTPGLINFGLLLWMPNDLVAKGYSMALSSKLLAESALIAFPTVFVCTGFTAAGAHAAR